MSLLAVLFASAMLVWLVPIVRSGRLVPLALMVLVSGTIFGPQFFAINGPIQISLDRILFAAMLVVAVAGLRLRTTHLPALTRGDALVVAMVVWFFVSAVTADGPPPKTPPLARWLFYVAMPAGMYAVARMISVRQQDVRWLSRGVIGLGVYLAVTAVFEVEGLHSLVFPRYVVDPHDWEFFGRGRGPLMNPSGNAMVMSIAAAFAAMGFVGAPRHRRLVLGVVMLCLMTGIYATLTRSAWLGGLSAVATVIIVHSPRWVRTLGLATAVFLVAIAATGLKDEILQLKRDKNLSAADAAKSVQLRPLLAVVAWEMFQDKPLTGHGYGRYLMEHERYLQDRSYGLPLEQARPYMQHNVFLSVLVDTGLIGFSLFVGWCTCVVAAGWKLARGGISRIEVRTVGMVMVGTFFAYLCNGMFQDVMIIPMVHMFLFFLGGLTLTTMQAGIESEPAKAPRAATEASTAWGESSVGTPPPWGSVPTRADFGVELRPEDG